MLGFGKRKSVSPGNIAAVVSGQIIPIEKVKDEAFAKKMMGACIERPQCPQRADGRIRQRSPPEIIRAGITLSASLARKGIPQVGGNRAGEAKFPRPTG